MAFGNLFSRAVYNHSPMFIRDLMAGVYSKRMGEKKFGLRFAENLADLERRQWYDQEAILQVQYEKLRRTVWQAWKHVPYYRGMIDLLDLKPGEIRNAEDLRRLPIIHKLLVRKHSNEFESTLYRNSKLLHVVHTSGTSGNALKICVDVDYLMMEKAYVWLQRKWCGVSPGDRSAQFTGQPVVPLSRKKPPFWIYDRSENRTIYSLRHMSARNLEAYARHLVTFKPELIVGYPTAIYFVALSLIENGIDTVRPRGVFTASETLFTHQREVMERAFGCKVMDLYGQAEFTGMIIQCEEGNYHTQEDYGVIEILDDNGRRVQPGTMGRIVATGLNNMAMPFIRYQSGDMAVPKDGPCPCGRCGSLIEQITGRIEDVIRTPDGRLLSRLDFVFKEIPFVHEAQLIQERLDLLRVRLVPRGDFAAAEEVKLVKILQEHTGMRMRIEFDVVEEIPRLPSGKFRFVISKVPIEFGGAMQVGEVLGISADEEKSL